MARGKVGLKFQIRLETPRGWSALSDEDQQATYMALQAALDRLGVEGKGRLNLYGPHWEEHNVSRTLTELVWEFELPVTVVEKVGL